MRIEGPQLTTHLIPASPVQEKDYTMIIDKSGSMSKKDMPNNQSRWQAAAETTYAIAAKVFEFDPDGIDIWLFANSCQQFRNQTPEKVEQIFKENEPFGGTNMAEVLRKALDEYFLKRDTGRLQLNGELILVVTDGEPDNQKDVIDVLTSASRRLMPKDKLLINFIPIGKDPAAHQFMKYLDTQLASHGAPRDIVEVMDVKEIEQHGIKQAILNTLARTGH
jgi:uncharacterized protein with von Willebrand factor type A (vWA) domain